MKLIHYSGERIDALDKHRTYCQSELTWQAKPNGLWISVDGDESWEQWCKVEGFNLENLKYAYNVVLGENANILYIKTPEELFEFTKKFPLITRHFDCEYDTYQLDWIKVKELYDGIIISPYQWPCRLALESCWYYGWDCASGCIWNLNCIEEFKLMECKEECLV